MQTMLHLQIFTTLEYFLKDTDRINEIYFYRISEGNDFYRTINHENIEKTLKFVC